MLQGESYFKDTLPLITLRESDHTYIIRNDEFHEGVLLHSTTKIVQSMFSPFLAHVIAKNIVKSKNPATIAKYKSILNGSDSPELLVNKWKDAGVLAAKYGTNVHKYIETFLLHFENEDYRENINMSGEYIKDISSFKDFYDTIVVPQKWTPFILEMAIFDRDYPIAGSVDAIFKVAAEKDRFIMCDWKTSKTSLRLEGKKNYGKYGKGPLSKMKDNKINRYFLQQNIYRYILEKKKNCYNIVITDMYLCVLVKNKHFEFIPVDFIDNCIIEQVIEHYLQKK